uniref:helix-turn-helix domain-containing protein n=1 Tax=uncultured Erythrobacter sp. TaxID=263913 RepID=UPI002638E0B3|nr:AraC family transcriptional regulator [uncultured Erythrobacter sp.]
MPCVLFGVSSPVLVAGENESLCADIVCIKPDVPHAVSISGGGAEILFLDGLQFSQERPDFSSLDESFSAVPKAVKDGEVTAIEALRNELSRPMPDPDQQVLDIAARMYAAPMRRLSQVELAEQLGLERTQALKHFKSNTGLTFRKFKIWCASIATVRRVIAGDNIGAAGIDSGFSDAAHVARTARDVFGITPSKGIAALTQFKTI